MPGCAALGCNNRSEKGFMMKCFPRDPVLRQIWKERVGRSDWEPSNNSFLCHTHFETNQWIVTPNGRVKLKKGALPTIFPINSKRKSSRKRGVSESDNGESVEDYLLEYYPNNRASSTELQSLTLAMTSKDTLQNDNNAFDNLLSESNRMNQIKCDDNNVSSNQDSHTIKMETEKRSSDEYQQIEKKLKLVCEGEKYEDLIKKKASETKDNIKKVTERYTCDSPSINDQLQFTIKVSGVADDVYEIIGKSDESVNGSSNNKNPEEFVTSEIIVKCPKKYDTLHDDMKTEDNSSSESDDEPLNMRDFFFVDELMRKCRDLESKVQTQQKIIVTLSNHSISHRDIANSMKLMEAEIKKKDAEIEQLRSCQIKKVSDVVKKYGNKANIESEIDEPMVFKISSRIHQLEITNKQLMKSLNSEVEKRRKAEYQVRDRENKIKELKWKLEKASKFYERSEKNTNTYRRKLSTLQTLLRRKNLSANKTKVYDDFSKEYLQGSFSKKSMDIASSILKCSGHRGYAKMLMYNFPLPPLKVLLQQNQERDKRGDMVNSKVLDKTIPDKTDDLELASGTVQDIFNESSDVDYDMDINEFKKYVLTDENPS